MSTDEALQIAAGILSEDANELASMVDKHRNAKIRNQDDGLISTVHARALENEMARLRKASDLLKEQISQPFPPNKDDE